MSQCFAMCQETPGNSIFIKFSIASRWVKNTSWLVETDPPIQIALVFFPKYKALCVDKYILENTEIVVSGLIITWE